MALDLGTLVGHIQWRHDPKGLRDADRDVTQSSKRWETDAKRGGDRAGKAAGDGISRGVSEGSQRAGKAAGDGISRGVGERSQKAGKAAGDGIARGVGEGSQRAGKVAGENISHGVSEGTRKAESSIKSLGVALAGAWAVQNVVSFMGNAVRAAQSLGETVSKSRVIFKDNADEMNKWASEGAKNFGLSKDAALGYASSLGDMFMQIGFSADSATNMSRQVVQLAADLGSFNDLDTADVMERINAAFIGEYDGLQKVIPNISAARIETEALAASGKRSADSLTAQEKAAAVLSIITKDSARAQGDFARTSQDAANAERVVAAEYENASAALGTKLLPLKVKFLRLMTEALPAVVNFAGGIAEVVDSAGPLVGVVTDLVKGFTDLPGPVQVGLAALVGIVALRGQFSSLNSATSSAFKSMKDSVVSFRDSYRDAQGSFSQGIFSGLGASAKAAGSQVGGLKNATGSLVNLLGGPWGLAFIGAGIVLTAFTMHQERAKRAQQEAARAAEEQRQKTEALSNTMEAGSGKWTNDTIKMEANNVATDKAIEGLERYGITHEKVASAMADTSSRDGLIASINREIEARQNVIDEYEREKNAFDNSQSGAAAKRNFEAENRGRINGIKNEISQLQAGKSAVEAHGNALDAASAQAIKRGQTENAMTNKVKEGTAASKESSLSIGQWASKLDSATYSTETAGQKIQGITGEIKLSGDAAKDAKTFMDQYGDALGYLSGNYKSGIKAQMDFEAATDAVAEAVDKNGRTLDYTNEKGRANRDVLFSLADASNGLLRSRAAEGANVSELNELYDQNFKAISAAAQKMGATPADAAAMATSLLGPKSAVAGLNGVVDEFNSKNVLTATIQENGAHEVIGLIDGISFRQDIVHGKKTWVRVGSNAPVTKNQIDALNAAVRDKSMTVRAIASTGVAEFALASLVRPRTAVVSIVVAGAAAAAAAMALPRARGGLYTYGDGALVPFDRGGGVSRSGASVPRVSQLGSGGDIYWPMPGGGTARWQEPWLPWEAYISGDPAIKDRSIGILSQAADRLGVRVVPADQALAPGGFFGSPGASSPATPAPLSSAWQGDMASMLSAHARQIVDAILEEHTRPAVVPTASAVDIVRRAEREKKGGRA